MGGLAAVKAIEEKLAGGRIRFGKKAVGIEMIIGYYELMIWNAYLKAGGILIVMSPSKLYNQIQSSMS